MGILTLAVIVLAGMLIGERMGVGPNFGRFIHIVTSEEFETITLTRDKDGATIPPLRVDPEQRLAVFPATKLGEYTFVIKWPRGNDSKEFVSVPDENSVTKFVDRAARAIDSK